MQRYEESSNFEKHYIGLDKNNNTYRMNITDVRDICSGIELAAYSNNSINQIFNLCSNQSFNFEEAVNYLSKFTGKDVVKVKLFTNPYNYETSNEKAKSYFGYSPIYDVFNMIEEGANIVKSGINPTEFYLN